MEGRGELDKEAAESQSTTHSSDESTKGFWRGLRSLSHLIFLTWPIRVAFPGRDELGLEVSCGDEVESSRTSFDGGVDLRIDLGVEWSWSKVAEWIVEGEPAGWRLDEGVTEGGEGRES